MHQNTTPLAVGLRNLARSPAFHIGLAIRTVLLIAATPWIWANWFVPFVQAFLAAPGIDPWTPFLAAGGDPLSYPYGPVMLVANSISVSIGNGIAALTGLSAAEFGFGLSLLAADIAILLCLCRLCDDWGWRLLLFYWLSPLAIYITYFHGQVDILPLALLMAGLVTLRDRRPLLSGSLFGLSVAAKLTFLLAVPLPLIFLWRSKRQRAMIIPFLIATAAAVLILQAPYLLSPGVQEMTLRNPNAHNLYSLAVEMAPLYTVYLAPLGYLLLLYSLWRLERLSFDLLIAGTGLAFLIIVILTPATVGWYMWIIPFMAVHQRNVGATGIAIFSAFSVSIIAFHLVVSTGAAVPLLGLTGAAPGAEGLGTERILPLVATVITVLGIVLGLQIWRRGIQNNDFYRLSRHPVTVGIAGDSGSGKDTLSAALGGLFGEHSVVAVSGDDYHLWDRAAPMWHSYTHLNPQANDLASLARDVAKLRQGHTVMCRHYDHSTGRFTPAEPRAANDCIIVSGLHVLHISSLGDQLDTSIYLDMDEELRRYLKVSRDMRERGHVAEAVLQSIDRRRPDSERFIRPQAERADVVFSLRPENRDILDDPARAEDLTFALDVTLRYGFLYRELARVLIGVCGLRLDAETVDERGTVTFSIEGDVDGADLELAARLLLPAIDELLDVEPKWLVGMTGVMQLIALMQIAETLRSRGAPRRMA